jgi:gliding motility-associated-like protein
MAIGQSHDTKMYFGHNKTVDGSVIFSYLDFTFSPPQYVEEIINDFEGHDNYYKIITTSSGNDVYVGTYRILDQNLNLISGVELINTEYISHNTKEQAMCKVPGEETKYYYFYSARNDIQLADGTSTYSNRLQYHIIDIDSLGVSYSVEENHTVLNQNKIHEGMELIRKYGDDEFWLLTYDIYEQGLRTYLIDENGVTDQGIVLSFPSIYHCSTIAGLGELDYRNGKVVMADYFKKQCYVFEFDPNTGLAENIIQLPNTFPNSATDTIKFNHTEFSPDASKLYYSSSDPRPNFLPPNPNEYVGHQKVFVYDFNTMSASILGIDFQEYIIAEGLFDTTYFGLNEIELGPDGKLYSTQTSSHEMVIIESPNDSNTAITTISMEDTYSHNFGKQVSEGIQPDVYPHEVEVDVTILAPSCSDSPDGSASIEVVKGMPPFNYLWDDSLAQTTATALGLSEGFYNVIVGDWYGKTDTITIEVMAQDSLQVEEFVSPETCFTSADGSVSLNIEGGEPPYSIDWFGVNTNALIAGIYEYTITDTADCYYADSIELVSPEELLIESVIQDITCFGVNDGTIEITSTGGTGSYEFTWTSNNGYTSNTEDVNSLEEGIYELVLEDENECMEQIQITLIEPNPISLELLSTLNSNCDIGGAASVLAQGDFEPFVYSWESSNGELYNGNAIEDVIDGVYGVKAIDVFGCESDVLDVSIAHTENPDAQFSVNSLNFIQEDIVFTDSSISSEETQISTWHWDFDDGITTNEQNPTHIYTEEGTYYVSLEVTDANGCSAIFNDYIAVLENDLTYIPNAFSPNGDNLNDTFQAQLNEFDTGTYEMIVYDRWGKQVFYSTRPSIGWDGTDNGVYLPNGTYVYLVRYQINQQQKEVQGTVFLLQ